ncbi:CQI_4a_G0006640.mRNA.1.CDS.1 [Saccharomyces cerevisiae]|nr:CQI_4a_G0006640.mRNA.1.CDS.1 [Saccharomyces cerevisiae]CAI7176645.1 CQI_4a_G0006640.mRNA.1.CDS.1 [Saccharomyces cerevisiae]
MSHSLYCSSTHHIETLTNDLYYLNLPYSHNPLHSMAILTKSVPNTLTSLFTALASAAYTLCHLPIMPMIIHILISISHSAAPNIV